MPRPATARHSRPLPDHYLSRLVTTHLCRRDALARSPWCPRRAKPPCRYATTSPRHHHVCACASHSLWLTLAHSCRRLRLRADMPSLCCRFHFQNVEAALHLWSGLFLDDGSRNPDTVPPAYKLLCTRCTSRTADPPLVTEIVYNEAFLKYAGEMIVPRRRVRATRGRQAAQAAA